MTTPTNTTPTPIDYWMEMVHATYQSFSDRISPASWTQILEDDMATDEETRSQAEDALLTFLQDHYYIPKDIWKLLDQTFHWMERRHELYEKYPRNFVDLIIVNGLHRDPAMSFDLFTPGADGDDCDTLINLHTEALSLEPKQYGPLIKKMSRLSENHPCTEQLKNFYRLSTGNRDKRQEAFASMKNLAQTYPKSPVFLTDWAYQCLKKKRLEAAERYARRALTLDPEFNNASYVLAQALAAQEKYDEAKEIVYRMSDLTQGTLQEMFSLSELLKEWNKVLIPRLQAALEEDPSNEDARIELGRCYLQSEENDKALQVVQELKERGIHTFDALNLFSKAYYTHNKIPEAADALKELIPLQKALQPDGTDKTEQRIRKIPDTLQFCGECLTEMGEEEEANRYLQEAYDMAPENPEVVNTMAHILHDRKEYTEAIRMLEHLVDIHVDTPITYYELTRNLYALGRDEEALNTIFIAMDSDSYNPYFILEKMHIMVRNGLFEAVHADIQTLEERGLPKSLALDWIKALLIEYEEENEAMALDAYHEIRTRLDDGEEMPWSSEVDYRIARIQAELFLDEEEFEDALPWYEKALALEAAPDLQFSAGLCRYQLCDFAGAEADFLRTIEMAPTSHLAHFYLSCIYEATGRYEDAMKENEIALQIAEEANEPCDISDSYEHKIQMLRRMENPREAVKTAQELYKKYQDETVNESIYDIFLQFALWKPLDHMLDKWTQAKKEDKPQNYIPPRPAFYRIQSEILRGNVEEAQALFHWNKKHLTEYHRDQLEDTFDNVNGNYKNQIRKLQDTLTQENVPDYMAYPLTKLALNYFWDGSLEPARDFADQALAILDQTIPNDLLNAAMNRGHKAVALAILGKTEEALQELAEVRQLPLCRRCNYSRCKDADIYEAHILEIAGDKEKALELYQAGMNRWPDDADFLAGVRRLS